MKRKILSIAVLFFIPFISQEIQAVEIHGLQPLPPNGIFSTFSAESLKSKKTGIGFGFEISSAPKFYYASLQSGYGLTDRMELNFSAPYIWDDKVGGFEDINFGLKHRVIEEDHYNPALAYIIMFSPPTGKEYFSTNTRLGGGLILTKKVGPFKGHINALYFRPEKSTLREKYVLNLGCNIAVSNNMNILSEISGNKDYFEKQVKPIEWRIGYRIEVPDNLYTTIGGGFDITAKDPEVRFLMSIGLILPFEKKIIYKEE